MLWTLETEPEENRNVFLLWKQGKDTMQTVQAPVKELAAVSSSELQHTKLIHYLSALQRISGCSRTPQQCLAHGDIHSKDLAKTY